MPIGRPVHATKRFHRVLHDQPPCCSTTMPAPRGVQEVAAGCLLIGARWRSALSPVGTSWSTRPRETELAVEPQGSILGLSLWHTRKTGVAQDYDFGIAGISEMKVVTSGELHIEHEGRKYIAYAGDTMMFLTDPLDRAKTANRGLFSFASFSTTNVQPSGLILPSVSRLMQAKDLSDHRRQGWNLSNPSYDDRADQRTSPRGSAHALSVDATCLLLAHPPRRLTPFFAQELPQGSSGVPL